MSSILQWKQRGFSLRHAGMDLIARLAGQAGRRASRRNRVDLDHLPDSLRRDIGLSDGGPGRGRNAAWRAALLIYPPRGL